MRPYPEEKNRANKFLINVEDSHLWILILTRGPVAAWVAESTCDAPVSSCIKVIYHPVDIQIYISVDMPQCKTSRTFSTHYVSEILQPPEATAWSFSGDS